MTNTNTKRNWVVVVDTHNGVESYLGSCTPGIDVSIGSNVREDDRCGVRRIENALRFTKVGAQRLAKGYTNGSAKEVVS